MQTTQTVKLYGGADLHGSNVLLSLCDDSGNQVYRRRVKANIEAVLEALAPYKDQLERLGVESTYNWYWFVDGLMEHEYSVDLGNPAKMQQYKGIKSTNDLSDAAWLAEQERLGIFPACYIYPKKERAVRDALRRRQLIAQQRTQALLSTSSLLTRYGQQPPDTRALKKWTQTDIENTGLEPFVQLQLRMLLTSIQCADGLINEIETAVYDWLKPTQLHERIQQLPGIGLILGATIVLETGTFSRFKNAGCYASYCRTVKSERTSNSKKKGENNKRNGNKYLAWAFVEAANFAVRYYPPIQAWYDKKKKATNQIVAKKALASKLAKATWHVMRGSDFDMNLLFG
jgi:transposase